MWAVVDCVYHVLDAVQLTVWWTLPASLSGTFLQTLLVCRFGYATEGALRLYLRAAVHRRGQRPPKGLGTNMY